MATGIVGIILPLLPGLILVLGAGLWWTIADGGGAGRWTVFALMAILLVIGTVAKYVLPAKATADQGAPWTTLLVGAVGAVGGFFVVPVVGLLLGGVAGIYLAELVRLGDWRLALTSTRIALVAFGIGMLIELFAGIAMALTWVAGALVF